MQCEQYKVVSWYQKRCEHEAKYKVTRKHLFTNGTSKIGTQNLCQYCARPYVEDRRKLDNHTYVNDSSLDHEYPKIERLSQIGA